MRNPYFLSREDDCSKSRAESLIWHNAPRPHGISEPRWNAIVKHTLREIFLWSVKYNPEKSK